MSGERSPAASSAPALLALLVLLVLVVPGGPIARAAAAPPAPTIESPVPGEVTTERRPPVLGRGVAGEKVVVDAAGVEVCHNSPVRPDGTWSCRPSSDLPLGRVQVVAIQVDSAGEESPAASVTFAVAPEAPVITAPRARTRLTDRTPMIEGVDAVAGARVRVFDRGRGICAAVADRRGGWSCAPRAALARGSHVLRASQRYRSAASPLSPSVVVRVVAPPPDAPSNPPSDPPSDPPSNPPPDPPPSPLPPADPAPSTAPPAATGPAAPDAPDASKTPKTPKAPTAPVGRPGPGAEPRGDRSARVQVPLEIRPPAPLVPGEAASITGSVGPSRLDRQVRLTMTGSLTAGLLYRDVRVSSGTGCVVRTRAFSCVLVLGPGRTARMRILLVPDALAATARAVQRLSVTSAAGPVSEVTSTLDVAPVDPETGPFGNAAETPASQLVILLALFMFALAARASERRPHRPGD